MRVRVCAARVCRCVACALAYMCVFNPIRPGTEASYCRDAQQDAYAACADKPQTQATVRIARLGSWGKHPSNIERDMHRLCQRELPVDISMYSAPVRVRKEHALKQPDVAALGAADFVDLIGEEVLDHPICMPYEWLAALWSRGLDEFHTLVGGGSADFAYFWEKARSCEWAATHPVYEDPAKLSLSVPFALFGDDAGVFENEKALMLLLTPVLNNQASTWDCRLPLAVMPYAWINDHTLEDLYMAIQWGCAVGFGGVWPSLDHLRRELAARIRCRAGEPLAGGYRMAIIATDGDYKWHKETFRFDAYNNIRCCHRCRANKKNIGTLYTDFSATAGWRATLLTAADYFASVGDKVSPLALIPGWSPTMARTDIMHNLFSGSANKSTASALIKLVTLGWFDAVPGHGTSWPLQLKRAWLSLKAFVKRLGLSCSQPCFTRKRLNFDTNRCAPSVKAKAYNSRIMVAWIAEECGKAVQAGHDTLHDKMRASVTWGLAKFCSVLDNSGRCMSPAEVASARRAGVVYLQTFAYLARDAVDSGVSLWPLKPKMHQFDHLLDDLLVDMMNPRFWWNFGNEDCVGLLKRIAMKCSRKTVASAVLRRYMIKIGLRWRRRDVTNLS